MSLTAKQIYWRQVILGSGVVCGFVVLIVFGLWVTDTGQETQSPMERAQAEAQELVTNYRDQVASELSPHDKWISKSEQELINYKNENEQLHDRMAEMEKKLGQLTHQVEKEDTPSPSPSSKPSVLDEPLPGAKEPNTGPLASTPVKPGGASIDSFQVSQPRLPTPVPVASDQVQEPVTPELEVFTVSEIDQDSAKNVSHYIPAGSFMTVSLLSGVDALTGGATAQDAQPILMRLMDYGILPNHFRANIVDCHVTGTVRGVLSSERARVRSEFLSCIFENGDVVEVKIKGWVNGEDGKDGFRGRLVEKSGALLARTFVSGMFSGLGSSIASQYQSVSTNALGSVTTIDPGDASKAGLAVGTSTAFEKIADYYMARANEIFPIIEVSSHRLGELVLQQGVDLGQQFETQMRGQP